MSNNIHYVTFTPPNSPSKGLRIWGGLKNKSDNIHYVTFTPPKSLSKGLRFWGGLKNKSNNNDSNTIPP